MATRQLPSSLEIALVKQRTTLWTQQAYEQELLEEIANLQNQLREENDNVSKDDLKVLFEFADTCNFIARVQGLAVSLVASINRAYEEHVDNDPEFIKAWDFLASITKERESQDCAEDNDEIKKLAIVKSFAELRKEVGG